MSCTIRNNNTEQFYDLSHLARVVGKDELDWNVRGYDSGKNFSINICAPLLLRPEHVYDDEPFVNVSGAAYINRKTGEAVSIGRASGKLMFRGRRLVLEYKDGAHCTSTLRKTTTLSFHCDRDVLPRAVVNYVSSPNDCDYFFEVRTSYACPTVQQQALGPFTIFGIILLVAAAVYCIGGCMYQRNVMQARGFRQVPHLQSALRGCSSVVRAGANLIARLRGVNIAARNASNRGRVQSENALIDEADDSFDRWRDEDDS